ALVLGGADAPEVHHAGLVVGIVLESLAEYHHRLAGEVDTAGAIGGRGWGGGHGGLRRQWVTNHRSGSWPLPDSWWTANCFGCRTGPGRTPPWPPSCYRP